MSKNGQVYFFILIVLLNVSCTKLSPELGFRNLNLSEESLTLETNSFAINAQTASSTVQLKGSCETNTHLQLKVSGKEYSFKCEDLKYSKEILASLLVEGENLVVLTAYDDAENKIGSKELKLIKDTGVPTVTLTGPTNISGVAPSISLSGTCSEEGLEIRIVESIFAKGGSARCENNSWSYSHDISNQNSGSEFIFKATHSDSVGNEIVSLEHIVSRAVLGDFTITGVNTDGSANYKALLKTISGPLHIGWSTSSGAQSYKITLQKSGTNGFTDICSRDNISSTFTDLNLSTNCSVTYGDSLRIIVDAKDMDGIARLQRQFLFRVKSPASINADSQILYISNEGVGETVPYSSIIDDTDSTGPFSISIVSYDGLTSSEMIPVNSPSSLLAFNPGTTTSGIFNTLIRITDENGIVSGDLPLKIAVTSAYSWAGLIDNDFNNKANWCGTVTLKGGCKGDATFAPMSTSSIVIDNLCTRPTSTSTSSSCAPILTLATTVKSFFMKDKTFLQNSNSLNIGLSTSTDSFFRMTGGSFNMSTSTGDITVNRSFLIEGGLFTAPSASILTLNTQTAVDDSFTFKVTNNSFFDHNNGTVILVNTQGQQLRHGIQLPDGFRLKNLTINSAGGIWKINSPSLIIEGDLTLSGSKYASAFYPYLNGTANSSSVIKLRGNLNCDGPFGGGDLPIYIESGNALYKSTVAGCKFPPIKITSSSYRISEHTSSSQNIVLQSLNLSGGGTFFAPFSRSVIFRTKDLDDTNSIADLGNGFDPNGSTVIFEGADASSTKNYKITLGTMESVKFIGATNSANSFYDLQNDFMTNNLYLEGVFAARLRGAGRTISANHITMVTGLTPDANILSKIKLLPTTPSSIISVTTGARIYIPHFEIGQNAIMHGSSNFDFTGTTFDLNSYDLTIQSGTLQYRSKTGTGNIIGTTITAP